MYPNQSVPADLAGFATAKELGQTFLRRASRGIVTPITAPQWQSETWTVRQDLPGFMAAHDTPLLGDGPSWRRFFQGGEM